MLRLEHDLLTVMNAVRGLSLGKHSSRFVVNIHDYGREPMPISKALWIGAGLKEAMTPEEAEFFDQAFERFGLVRSSGEIGQCCRELFKATIGHK